MEAIREISDRTLEIVKSTTLYMYNSGRDAYSAATTEIKNLDRLWTKRIKPKSEAYKEHAIAMLTGSEVLDPKDDRMRNLYAEFYFGISVVLFGLIGGEYIGAMLNNFCENSWFELGLLFVLPYHYWKNQTELFDESKNRLHTFGKLLLLGVLFGHVFPARILNTVPANISLLPFVFAVLLDPKFESIAFCCCNRKKLVGVAFAIAFITSYFTMYILGNLGFVAIIFMFFQAALLYAHFCFLCEATKGKEMNAIHETFQLIYVLSLIFVQFVLTILSIPATHHHAVAMSDSTDHKHTDF